MYPTGCVSWFFHAGTVAFINGLIHLFLFLAGRVPRFCIEHRHDHHLDVRHVATNVYMGEDAEGVHRLDVRNIKVSAWMRGCVHFSSFRSRAVCAAQRAKLSLGRSQEAGMDFPALLCMRGG